MGGDITPKSHERTSRKGGNLIVKINQNQDLDYVLFDSEHKIRHGGFMKRVLFVCLGNICRSPTAEAVFKDRVESAGLEDSIKIDSAGTIAAHAGHPADSRMSTHASARGYELTSISRKVTLDDFTFFTHIYAMDKQNLSDLKAMAPNDSTVELELFLSLDSSASSVEVPDPYYGGAHGFETVLDLIESASDCLLAHLREET